MKVFAVAVSLACLIACNRSNIDTKEAVRQGVIDHFATSKNLNVSSMNIEVTSVTFKENEADATVAVTPKGGGSAMPFHYTLERKGSHWVVKPRATGENPHSGMGAPGGMGDNPHGGMPGSIPPGEMPPGHPAVPPK